MSKFHQIVSLTFLFHFHLFSARAIQRDYFRHHAGAKRFTLSLNDRPEGAILNQIRPSILSYYNNSFGANYISVADKMAVQF